MNELDILKQQWQELNATEVEEQESKEHLRKQIEERAETAWGKIKRFAMWDSGIGGAIAMIAVLFAYFLIANTTVKAIIMLAGMLILLVVSYNIYFLRWVQKLLNSGQNISETYPKIAQKLRRNYNMTIYGSCLFCFIDFFLGVIIGVSLALDEGKSFGTKHYVIVLVETTIFGVILYCFRKKYKKFMDKLLYKIYLSKLEAFEQVVKDLEC